MQLIPFDIADLIVSTSTTQGGNGIMTRSICGALAIKVSVLIGDPATSSDYELLIWSLKSRDTRLVSES